MPFYRFKDRQPARKLTLCDLDIIRHHGYYLPNNTDLARLDQELSQFDVYQSMAWHLRALSEKHRPQRTYYPNEQTYYLLAPHHISHVVKFKNDKKEKKANSTLPKVSAKVFKTIPKRITYQNQVPPVWEFPEVLNVWTGMNTHPNFYRNSWNGNALILQDQPDHYVELSNGQRYDYQLPEGETIQSYYAIISRKYIISNSSDWKSKLDHFSTFAFAFTTQNRILFRGQIIDNPLVYPSTPFFSLFYQKYLKEHHVEKIESKCYMGLSQEECFCPSYHSDCQDNCHYQHEKYQDDLINRVSIMPPVFLGQPYNDEKELDISMWNLIPIRDWDFYLPPDTDRNWLIEQFKLINLDYVDRLAWEYQHTSNEELHQKQWRPKDPSAPNDVYQIMVNGYCDFECRIENGVIKVYNQYEWVTDEDNRDFQKFSDEPFYTIEDYEGYWLGENLSNVHYIGIEHGNHIIVKLNQPNQYLHISRTIDQFTLDQPIAAYYSPIGNNGVPYDTIVTQDGRIIRDLYLSPVGLPATPFFGDFLVSLNYSHLTDLSTQDESNSYRLEQHQVVGELETELATPIIEEE